jgi:hypothetical protein
MTIQADAGAQLGGNERVVGVRIDDQFDLRPIAGLARWPVGAGLARRHVPTGRRRRPVVELADQDERRRRHDTQRACAPGIEGDAGAEFMREHGLDQAALERGQHRSSAQRYAQHGHTIGAHERLRGEEFQGLIGIERLLLRAAAAGVRPVTGREAIDRNCYIAPACQPVRPGHRDIVQTTAAVQHDDGWKRPRAGGPGKIGRQRALAFVGAGNLDQCAGQARGCRCRQGNQRGIICTPWSRLA